MVRERYRRCGISVGLLLLTGSSPRRGKSVQRLTGYAAQIAIIAIALSACTTVTDPLELEYQNLDLNDLAANAREVVDCVRDATGYEVTAGSDGSVGYTSEQVPLEQAEIVDTAIPDCFEKLGFVSSGPLSVEQLKRLYRLQVIAKECLANEGFSTSDTPSEQVFIDTWNTPNLWAPWAEMGRYELTVQEFQDLLGTCPDPASFPPEE